MTFQGSSPHTRGAQTRRWCRYRVTGIIPAYAGSTRQSRTDIALLQDHPRIRGEHGTSMQVCGLWPGSSPHTRGAPAVAGGQGEHRGIIPAYAGSTPRPGRHALPAGDHPRIRGEHTFAAKHPATSAGSSPHTRGAPAMGWIRTNSNRIIPAYAGSTETSVESEAGRGDHPRIRGEHSRATIRPQTVQGSSPHTRGAPMMCCGIGITTRIIPAYAGSTRSRVIRRVG